MTTRDKRRARTQKRKNVAEESIPLYNDEGIRHNERVMRRTMEQDRRTETPRFRREKHQQIPIAPKGVEDRQDTPYINTEGIEHNKRVIEHNKEVDKSKEVKPEDEMTPEEKARHGKENAFKRLVEYLKKTKV